jgi:TonB-dependent receptor
MTEDIVRRAKLFAFWILLSGLSVTSLYAQTGSVRGVLVDSETGMTLIGASVVLEGTTTGSQTDIDGRYEIKGLAPGSYNLAVSYVGYSPAAVQNVQVQEGAATEINLSLSPESIGLEAFVVQAEALRNSEATLLRDRQRAAAVSDAISAEAISRSASSTAADAMQKVTGASVVDGKYINVRGLEGRYVNTQLNGAELASADPDRNAVPFDLFPSALLDNIVTVKTFTPDQPGSFTGGNINIGTKSFPGGQAFSVSISGSYDSEIGTGDLLRTTGGLDEIPAVIQNGGVPLITTATNNADAAQQLDAATRAFDGIMIPAFQSAPVNQSYSVSYGNEFSLFGDRPLGVVASLSYSQDVSGHEGGRVGQHNLLFPVSETNVLDTDIDVTDATGTQERLLGGLANIAFKPHPKHEIGLNLLYSRGDEDFARHQIGLLPRDLEEGQQIETQILQHTDRELRTIQGRGEHVFGAGQGIRLEWNSTFTDALQDEPDLRIFTSHFDTTGGDVQYIIAPSLYPKPTRYFRNMDETSWSNDLDLGIPVGSATLKVGGSYQQKDRTFRERKFQYERTTGYEGDPGVFFGEEIGLLEPVENGAPYVFGNYIQEVTQAANNYDADLMIGAGYAMIDTPLLFRGLRVIAGARLEYTDQAVRNNNRSGSIQATDVLPSLNVVYAVTENMNARLAYGRTLARPSFREFAPFNAYDFVNNVTIIGNPELRRTLVHNFDARWEWFPRSGELLAASAFYKDFTDPIEQVLNPEAFNREVTYENADNALVAGLEFEARGRLDRLANVMRHFQAGGNLTVAYSEVSIAPRELQQIRLKDPNASATRELQGQSPYVVNLDLGYDNPGMGTSLFVYYNAFGKRLDTVARSGTPNLYEMPRHTFDVVGSQRLPFGVELRLSVKNVLNARYEVSQEFKGRIYPNYRYDIGRSISLGLKYNL